MRNILLLLLTFISMISNGQNINTNDSIDYFSKGIAAFKNNDLIHARSFFMKSYKVKPEKNALFNVGQINLLLKDTCEACKWFKVVSEYYNDSISQNIYKKLCIVKIDTFYYNKKYQLLTSSGKYKYLEELVKTKCDTNGIIHKKGFNSTIKLGANIMDLPRTDIFAQYSIQNSKKIYNYIYGTTFESDNKLVFEKFKKNIKTHLNAEYDLDDIKHKDRYLLLELFIDNNGIITDGYSQNNPFKDYGIVTNDKISDEVIFFVKKIKNLKPAMIFKKPVCYEFRLYIGF